MKKIFLINRLIYLGISILILSGLIFSSCKKKKKHYSFSGKVKNMLSSNPVGDVTIVLYGSELSSGIYNPKMENRGESISDANGNYSINIPVKRYVDIKLKASKEGYYNSIVKLESPTLGVEKISDFLIAEIAILNLHFKKYNNGKKAKSIVVVLDNVNEKCTECVVTKRVDFENGENHDLDMELFAVAGETIKLIVRVNYEDNIDTFERNVVCKPGNNKIYLDY